LEIVLYNLRYYPAVKKDIKEIDRLSKDKIMHAIEDKLTSDPFSNGIPLKGNLSECYKLRIGNYRVVYEVQGNDVIIICIKHRKDVYNAAAKRK
jgi:mRNA interferase RelE/StbE